MDLISRFARLEAFPQPEIVRTRYPVVLMHGFGVIAALAREGQLHARAMQLRQHGVLAFAPNVDPYNRVAVRAQAWLRRIGLVLEETGHEKANLVAFSMGGLDARYLVRQLGGHACVASVTTLATPHHGTPAASYALERPAFLRSMFMGVMDWLGETAYRDALPDTRAALEELTPEYVCGVFNPAVPDHPEVRYWSYSSRAGRGTDVTLTPTLLLQNRIIYRAAGVNDGFVPEESARWTGFLGALDADHIRLIGLPFAAGRFDADAFFLAHTRLLAENGL